jgi:hypothetical protein
MPFVFILLIILVFLITYLLSAYEGKRSFNNLKLQTKFGFLIKYLNKHVYNGNAKITIIDDRELNLYELNQNQIINFQDHNGVLTITWKFKYYQKEVVNVKEFRDINNFSMAEQHKIGENMINETAIIIEKHKREINMSLNKAEINYKTINKTTRNCEKTQTKEKLAASNDIIEKIVLLSKLLSEIILEKECETSSEKEFCEAFVFATFCAFNQIAPYNEEERNDKMLLFHDELLQYVLDNEDSLETLNSGNTYQFLESRFKTYAEEITKIDDVNYLAIPIIYNLYLDPLNANDVNMNSILQRYELPEIIKYSNTFKIKFKHFSKVLNETVAIIQISNYGSL